MSNNRTPLKAWVRYDYNKMAVPSSIIYRRTKPGGRISHYQELIDPDPNFCCDPVAPSCEAGGSWADSTLPGPSYSYTRLLAVNSVKDADCNVYRLMYIDQDYSEYDTTIYGGLVVEKLDTSGTSIWQKKYLIKFEGVVEGDFVFMQNGENISFGVDGNLYITAGQCVIKIDTDGSVIWHKYLDCIDGFETCTNYPQFVTTLHAPSGRVYLVGMEQTASTSKDLSYVRVSELNPLTGDEIVANRQIFTISIPDLVTPQDVFGGFIYRINQNGELILTINSYSRDNSKYYCSVFKLDPDLNIMWSKLINPDSGGLEYRDIEPSALGVDTFNNIYVGLLWDYSLMKLDTNGNLLWSKYIKFNYGDDIDVDGRPFAIAMDEHDDPYVVIGDTFLPESSIYGIGVVKFDGGGNVKLGEVIYSTVSDLQMWWTNWSLDLAEIKSSTLYISAGTWNYERTITTSQLFKLPTTQIPEFTTGGYACINPYFYAPDANLEIQDLILQASTPLELPTYDTECIVEDVTYASTVTEFNV